MQWRSAVVGKATFDLGHLWPFEFVFEVAEKAGKRGQSYRLFVEFGMHCFTRGIKREERYGGDRVYRDSRGRDYLMKNGTTSLFGCRILSVPSERDVASIRVTAIFLLLS
jgi:hypothetical protein